MHSIPRIVLVANLLSMPLAAQTVQASITALQPLSATATVATTATSSSPAGALTQFGGLTASPGPGASASLSWMAVDSDLQTFVGLEHTLLVSPGPGGTAAVGQLEYEVTFVAPVPLFGRLEVARSDNLTGGASAATVALDRDGDGVYEIPSLDSAAVLSTQFFWFGPTPRKVRVRIANQLAVPGISTGSVSLMVRPENGLFFVPTAVGCGSAPMSLEAAPVFPSTGVRVTLNNSFGIQFGVLVLGLAQQPVLFPSLGGAPCLLVPRPDVLVPIAPSQIGSLDIGLPASVRPVTIDMQAATLDSALRLSFTAGLSLTAL